MTIRQVRQIFASHAPGKFTLVMQEKERLSSHAQELVGLYKEYQKGEDLKMSVQHCGEGRYMIGEEKKLRFVLSGLEENSVYVDVSNQGSSTDFSKFHNFLYSVKNLGDIRSDGPINWD